MQGMPSKDRASEARAFPREPRAAGGGSLSTPESLATSQVGLQSIGGGAVHSHWGGARTTLGAHSGRRQCCVPPGNQSRVLGPPFVPQPVISSIVAHREQWTRSCSHSALTFCIARLGGALHWGSRNHCHSQPPGYYFLPFVKGFDRLFPNKRQSLEGKNPELY